MSDLYKNKYRIETIRLKSWDYRWSAAYFITICTHEKECYFGEIENGTIKLSNVGVIANLLWYELPNRTKNLDLGEFIVMPNHIHGVLVLNDEPTVETLHARSKKVEFDNKKSEIMSNISPKAKSISTIVRSYKSAVTKHSNRLGFPFKWQSRFYEHIIRNNTSFDKISNYIVNNPQSWRTDKFYKQIK